jgi:hypothetical protein
MSKSKNLSKKKSDRLTISISPYLKEWIARYVKEQKKNYPSEDEYKSISSFVTSILESNLNLFQEGKSLEDFKKEPDHNTDEFYEKLTFRAFIKNYEENVEKSKYDLPNYKVTIPIYANFKSYFFENKHNNLEDNFVTALNRMKKFVVSNKVTKEINVEYRNNKFYMSFEGKYPNIQFINTKGLLGLFSALGLKLDDILVTKLHTRFEFSKTYLFETDELLSDERKRLYQENNRKLINLSRIINDKRHHLWIKMAQLDNTIISFRDYSSGVRDVGEMVEEIRETSDNFKINILKLFEQFNWIKIEENLERIFYFSLNLDEQEHLVERRILFGTLDKYGNLKQDENRFSFE